jgi:hypothetical protein
MPILHLGVIDLAYLPPQPTGPAGKAPKRVPKKPRAKIHARWRAKYANLTTGDVAEILEAKYHIFEVFYREHEQDVANDVTDSMQGAVESYLMGAPLNLNPFGSATSSIENRMKQFLANREMDALGIPGVPTEAARFGVSHRYKSGFNRVKIGGKFYSGVARSSFIDTGLFQASMTAWVD